MNFIKQTLRFLFVSSLATSPFTVANSLRSLRGNANCAALGPSEQHTTSISLNFFGAPDLLTDDDLSQLSKTFEKAYDKAGSSPCLNMQDVSVDVSTDKNDLTRRRMLWNHKHNGIERQLEDQPIEIDFTFVFLVSYQCYGCANDGIYDNDGSRRQLLQGGKPKRRAFARKFNRILRRKEVSNKVKQLNQVSEQQIEDQCKPTDRGLTEYIQIQLTGNYDALLRDDKVVSDLERAVKKSYNALNAVNPSTCDLLFRKVLRAEYISSTLESSTESEDTFTMTFETNYECRGCKELRDRRLFDRPVDKLDTGRDALAVDFRELGPREEQCSCGREAELFRSPLKSEYFSALRTILDVRSMQGKINVITGLSQVVVLDFMIR
mmetsp:Transcript_6317/g.9725  ORF Transcript_6317/g.9725 Transcript_6317/m.9725 type:complete len:379 (+) Transcript_6317:77-1213(+)